MIQNCDFRPNHSFEGGEVAFEVRNQQFDSNSWIERAYPKNRLGEMTCAAVGQVVAIYRGDNDVVEAEISHYQGNVAGLLRIKSQRLPLVDGTKAAAPCASISQDEKRGGFVAPALADVGAARFLTNGMEIFLSQNTLQPEIIGIARRFDFDPVGMSAR